MTEQDDIWEELYTHITEKNEDAVMGQIPHVSRQDITFILSRLNEDEKTWFLSLFDPGEAAELINSIPELHAASMISDLAPQQAGSIMEELPTEDAVSVLGELSSKKAEEILGTMEEESADLARKSLAYEKDTAGHIMSHDVLSFKKSVSIGTVREILQSKQKQYVRYQILYIFVVDSLGKLVGVMRIHDLLFAEPEALLSEMMIKNPLKVSVTTKIDEISDQFRQLKLLALPVVDENEKFVGIVLPSAVEEAKQKVAVKHFLWLSGFIGGEEYRSMPLYKRSGKRLSWLTLNIALNIIAASVIALYQEILAAVIALAVFLPMVSDMSGCSGNQAVAVSLRELSLGILRPGEILRVAFKESSLGILNGLVLGILLGVVAFIWKGNLVLSFVIGAALAGNTIVAVTFGGTLPLVLKKLKIDPALVSSPLLTTVTDMCGFFLVLSLASLVLPYLTV